MNQKNKVKLKVRLREESSFSGVDPACDDVFFEPHVVEEEILDPPIKDENGVIFGFYHPVSKPRTKSSLTILILMILNISLLSFFTILIWYIYAVGSQW